MSSYGLQYRAAAKGVQKGWAKAYFHDGDKVCIVQALLNATGLVKLQELDAQLMQYPSYRILRLSKSRPITECAWLWNDKLWRRKRTVVKVLNQLAENSRRTWVKEQQQGDDAARKQLQYLECDLAIVWDRLVAKHAPAPADPLEAAWALQSTAEPLEHEPIA
jgi:hypothetical protein